MNSLEKKCHSTEQDPIRKLLSKSKNCSSNPQYYIYLDLEVDSYYIVIPLRPIQVYSSLWQMQDGKPRLLGYASKSLPDACKNYSITELEMTGLVINIHLWKHLLLRVEFYCAVDHRALPYIMKSKNLPVTCRIIRLLEHLAGYSFNLYYVKGKDMILCDYLSRIALDNGDPGEVIPISFNALAQYRLAIDHITEYFMITNFMVATRSSTSAAGIKLPPVHGAQKGVDPNLKPES